MFRCHPRRLPTALMLAFALSMSAAASSEANTNFGYCYSTFGYGATCGTSVKWYLDANQSVAYNSIYSSCAAARDANLALYGSWICATDYACHSYSGSNALYGVMKSNSDGIHTYWANLWTPPDYPGSGVSCPRGYYQLNTGGTARQRAARARIAREQRRAVPALRSSAPRFVAGGPLPARAVGDPDRDRVCLEVTDDVGTGATCALTGRAANGQLLLTVEQDAADAPIVMVAAAPNGATSGTVSTASGDKIDVKIRAGLVAATVPADAQSLMWRGIDVPRSVAVH